MEKLVLIEVNYMRPFEILYADKLEELEIWDTRYFHHKALKNLKRLHFFEGRSALFEENFIK